MNDGKQSTPAGELERQICSATEPKNEREWWAHHEIARLLEISRLRAELLEASKAALTAERAKVERLDMSLRQIIEEWAGSECGHPVYAQEAYAIRIAKRMAGIAGAALEDAVGGADHV